MSLTRLALTNRQYQVQQCQYRVTRRRLTVDNARCHRPARVAPGNAGAIAANVGAITAHQRRRDFTSTQQHRHDRRRRATQVTSRSSPSAACTSQASTVIHGRERKGGDPLIDAQSVQLLSNGTLISANSNAPLLPDGRGWQRREHYDQPAPRIRHEEQLGDDRSESSQRWQDRDHAAPEMVQLINSQVSTSVGGNVGVPGASNGGNIKIDPQFVILQNSQILAQAFAGAGGAIDYHRNICLHRGSCSVSLTHRLHSASAGPSISSRRCRTSAES